MKVDAFFDGGGILGISFIGAYKALTDYGIQIDKVLGISSGSIVASLIAARFTASELIELLNAYRDFSFFKQKTKTAKKQYIGKPLSLLLNKGIYDSTVIEQFMEDVLAKKLVTTFQEMMYLGESKLKIIATDFTNKRLMLLPNDLVMYGYNPSGFKIATAVRMSCAIPFFYTPYEFKTKRGISYVIDGGVIRNIPTTLINNNQELEKITLRFKFKKQPNRWGNRFNDIKNTVSYKNNTNNLEKVITIYTNRKIKVTDFDISREDIIYLYKQGYKACYQYIRSELMIQQSL